MLFNIFKRFQMSLNEFRRFHTYSDATVWNIWMISYSTGVRDNTGIADIFIGFTSSIREELDNECKEGCNGGIVRNDLHFFFFECLWMLFEVFQPVQTFSDVSRHFRTLPDMFRRWSQSQCWDWSHLYRILLSNRKKTIAIERHERQMQKCSKCSKAFWHLEQLWTCSDLFNLFGSVEIC